MLLHAGFRARLVPYPCGESSDRSHAYVHAHHVRHEMFYLHFVHREAKGLDCNSASAGKCLQ